MSQALYSSTYFYHYYHAMKHFTDQTFFFINNLIQVVSIKQTFVNSFFFGVGDALGAVTFVFSLIGFGSTFFSTSFLAGAGVALEGAGGFYEYITMVSMIQENVLRKI